MLASTTQRIARRALQTRRNLSEAKFPSRGQSEGGHINVMQKDNYRKQLLDWKDKPEVLPLVGALAVALAFGTWKMFHLDMKPSEGPLSFLFGAKNNRDILGITASDEKLEYKK